MYPCINPGDALDIEYKKSEEIKIGDIAVYRRGNNLFAHRVIDKGYQEDSAYIVTRPDTSSEGHDGPIFDADIAGVVVGIERKGRIRQPEKIKSPLVKRIYLESCMLYFKMKRFLGWSFIYPLTFMQYSPVYRLISRLLFHRKNKELNFSISTPLKEDINCPFNRIVSPEELLSLKRGKDRPLKWAIALNVGYRPVAYLSFVYKPEDCCFAGWWMSEAKIINAYRATQIEEKILKESDGLLEALGARSVSVNIAKKDRLSRIIFGGLGFKAGINRYNTDDDFMVLQRKVGE